MHRSRRLKTRVLFRNWAPLLGVLTILIGPGLSAEELAEKPKPARLPTIELPSPPAKPEGVPLAREANARVRKGDYEGALPLYREAWDKGMKSRNSTYNSACAAAVTGHLDEAFVWLTRSAAAGWRDAEHLEVDTDLDSLRDDPRFAEFVKKVEVNSDSYDKKNNSELRALVEADQAARQNIPDMQETPEERKAFWKKTSADDAERRARVAEIVAAGGAKTGDDYYAAAMVYQHGAELADFARAREYAAKAVELGDEGGRWLAAAAWDRWLVNAGYPQRFGTQYLCNPDCELQEWDESTTDEERARWNVPPIEVAKHRMDGR